jgi:hypothetical protein
MYKLKNIEGRVNALLKTGNDFVSTSLSIAAAQHIINVGKMMKSDKSEYPICVDGYWYFEGEEVKKPKKVQASTVYGETKEGE